jgi:hypothetical protein
MEKMSNTADEVGSYLKHKGTVGTVAIDRQRLGATKASSWKNTNTSQSSWKARYEIWAKEEETRHAGAVKLSYQRFWHYGRLKKIHGVEGLI